MSKMLDYAVWYAKYGWCIFPLHTPSNPRPGVVCSCGRADCPHPGKHPRTLHGLSDATSDVEQIKNWWSMWPDANIGWHLGPSNKLAIDHDTYKEDAADLPITADERKTVTSLSGGGGEHLIYEANGHAFGSRNKATEGVDIKAWGGYIVLPPSKHVSGNHYQWEAGYGPHESSFLPVPDALLPLLHQKGVKRAGKARIVDVSELEGETKGAKKALDHLKQERCDNYDQWLGVGMALSELGDVGLDLWDTWSQNSDKYDEGVCEEKWATITPGDGLTLASLHAWAKEDDPEYRSNGNPQEEEPSTWHDDGLVDDAQPSVDDEPPNTESTRVERFRMYGPEHYLEPPPPIVWTVEGVLVLGSMMIVVGESGSGKTYTAMDLAACVALGKPWLGKNTRQGKVIILDEENGLHRMHRRLHEVINGHMGDSTTPLFFSTYNGLDMLDDKEEERLYSLIQEHEPTMIIIDALADIIPGADENSVKDVHKPLHKLHRMATFTGTSIIVIHHMNKGGRYRGSSTIKADVDTMLIVERKEESDIVNFSFEKLRDGNPVKFAAQAHWEEDQFWLSEAKYESDRPVFSKGQLHVLEYLAEHGASRMNDIMNAARICKPRTAKDAVYNLVQSRLVYRTNPSAADKVGAIFALTTEGKKC